MAAAAAAPTAAVRAVAVGLETATPAAGIRCCRASLKGPLARTRTRTRTRTAISFRQCHAALPAGRGVAASVARSVGAAAVALPDGTTPFTHAVLAAALSDAQSAAAVPHARPAAPAAAHSAAPVANPGAASALSDSDAAAEPAGHP